METNNLTDRTSAAPPVVGHEVYVGPRAFQTGETLYCRDRETEELVSLLISQRVVLLHSPSGAGKTSLIQANLVPALQAEDFEVPTYRPPEHPVPQPVIIRVNRKSEASDPPGANRYALSSLWSLELHRPEGRGASIDELAALTLDQYLKQEFPATQDAAPGPDGKRFRRPLLLVFDQFEELLTLDPTDLQAKADFVQQVGESLRNLGRWALFAIRDDYLGALEPYRLSIPTLVATYHLDLLRAELAKVAIEKPADKAGVKFEEGIVQELVDDLRQVQVQQLARQIRVQTWSLRRAGGTPGGLPEAMEDQAGRPSHHPRPPSRARPRQGHRRSGRCPRLLLPRSRPSGIGDERRERVAHPGLVR